MANIHERLVREVFSLPERPAPPPVDPNKVAEWTSEAQSQQYFKNRAHYYRTKADENTLKTFIG